MTSNYFRHLSALEHYMTSLRDPMFWKINKKIVDLVDSSLKLLPTYSRNELYFPGVDVVNIEVKKMMTAYDYFEFDVTDALKLDDSNSTFNVKIGQPRLNHKPFTVKVNISSLVAKKGLVKIYLGPKLMPGELANKKNLFTLLDVFEMNLKLGTNIISRTSDDMKHFASDFLSLKTIRKKMEDAEFGLDSIPLETIESQVGYPARLILPKGLPQGLPVQIFVFVAPFTKASANAVYSANNMEFNSAILSPGYPLDLMIEDKQLFALPNSLIKYVMITQKGDSKVENYGGAGVTKKWYGTNSYDPSSRPNYSQNNKKSFDYNSKKGASDSNLDTSNGSPIVTENYFDYNSVMPLKEDFGIFVENTDTQTVRSLNSVKVIKKPYDYKTNKEKNQKKDVWAKKDIYSTNLTSSKEDIAIPTITAIYEEIASDVDNQDNLIANTPHLLKAENYDYSSKSTERKPFDYQAKKAQFDKKDFSAKKVDYSKYRTISPVDKEIVTTSTITPLIEYPVDNVDVDNSIVNMPHLLKSSKFDYSSKKREPFDYKAKKAQFNNKDYSAKREDSNKYRTATPIDDKVTMVSIISLPNSTDDLARVQLDNNINNVDLLSEIRDNDAKVDEMKELQFNDGITASNLIDSDLVPIEGRKRIPTVYDFLFHTVDYEDNPELKVYE